MYKPSYHDRYHNQSASDTQLINTRSEEIVNEIATKAKQISNQRWPKNYFAGIKLDPS
jgi:hypothetical protein